LFRFYFHQLIDALEYIDKKGISHRDLKTENLMLDKKFNLKICDFGYGSFDDIASTRVGTNEYMAPEVRSKGAYKPQTADIFGAGVILFIMRTRNKPFFSSSSSDCLYRLIKRNKLERFWSVYDSADDPISEEFKDLVATLLAHNPIHRLSLSEIKNHPWYTKNVPDYKLIKKEFTQRKKDLIKSLKSKKEEEEEKVQKDPNVFESSSVKRGIEDTPNLGKVIEREEREYLPELSKVTQFFSQADSEDLWYLSAEFMKSIRADEITIFEEEYRIEGTYESTVFRSKEMNQEYLEDDEEKSEEVPTKMNVRFAINILKVGSSSTH
jgi:serine/threonine protein kinase